MLEVLVLGTENGHSAEDAQGEWVTISMLSPKKNARSFHVSLEKCNLSTPVQYECIF